LEPILIDEIKFYEIVQKQELGSKEIEVWLAANYNSMDLMLLSRLISLLEQKKIAYDLSLETYNAVYYRLAESKRLKGQTESFIHHIIKSASNTVYLRKLLNKYGQYNPILSKALLNATQFEDKEKYEEALRIYTERNYVPGIIWMHQKLDKIISDPQTEKEFRLAINFKLNTGNTQDIDILLYRLEEFAFNQFKVRNFVEVLANLKNNRIDLPIKYNNSPYTNLDEIIKAEQLVEAKKFYEAYYHLQSLRENTRLTMICDTLMKQIRVSVYMCDDFFNRLARENGFSRRENQVYMSKLIEEAMVTKQTVMIEAEVGIGKSFGYLVPALLHRHYSNSDNAIVVSTSSIVLQNQLINKDIPRINKLLAATYGILPVKPLIGKGKSNFACSNRLNNLIDSLKKESKSKDLPKYNVEKNKILVNYLIDFLNKSEFLDKSDAHNSILKDNIWRNISAERCSCKNNCKYIKYREELVKHNGIIVCNYQQLLAHLKNEDNGIKKGIFPPLSQLGTIIIDEAHKLEDAAKTVYTQSMSIEDLKYFHKRLSEIVTKRLKEFTSKQRNQTVYKAYDSLDQALEGLFHSLGNLEVSLPNLLYSAQFNEQDRTEEISLEADGARYKIKLKDAQRFFNDLFKQVKKVDKYITSILSYEDKIPYTYKLSVLNYIEVIQNIFAPKEYLSFAEKDMRESWIFHAMRKTFNDVLNKKLMRLTQPVILVSGTLRVNNSFNYMMKKIGYTTEFIKPQHLGNNFDYQNNQYVYIPKHVPSPSVRDQDYYTKISKEIIKLIELTQGRSLILFTNYSDLEEVFNKVRRANLPYKLLKQEKAKTTEQLITEFKNDSSTCLFASGSFFEGFDVPGDALEQVILVKLPYPVLDPVLEYEIKKAGDLRMQKVILPKMGIQLSQAIGRLIRRETDKGIISILDSRLHRPNYLAGDTVNHAVHPSRIYSKYEEIKTKWMNR
jgi:ATP-dependent DNA helicase DinG